MKEEARIENLSINDRVIISGRFPASKGSASIYYKRNLPKTVLKSEKTMNLTIIHGAVEYHARHELLPEYLISKLPGNMIITWIDLKGHGLSGGQRSYIEDFNEFSDDVVELLNRPIENIGSADYNFLLGHSMGGLVSLKTVLENKKKLEIKLDGLILSCPCVKVAFNAPIYTREVVNFAGEYIGKIRLPSLYKGANLTNDPILSRGFDTNPIISKFMTVSLVKEILNHSKRIRGMAYFLDMPVLGLLAEDDKLVDTEICKLFFRGIEKNLKTLNTYSGMKHEIFNEIEREKVFQDVYKWLIDHTKLV